MTNLPRKARRPSKRVCLQCERTFKPYTVRSFHCSLACAKKTEKTKRVAALVTKERKFVDKEIVHISCTVCDVDFVRNASNQKYCSPSCRKSATITKMLLSSEVNSYRIFERDDYRCVYCGSSPIEDGVKLHADHISPQIHGGPDIASNLVTACQLCNLSKSSHVLTPDNLLRLENLARDRNAARGISPETPIRVSSHGRHPAAVSLVKQEGI